MVQDVLRVVEKTVIAMWRVESMMTKGLIGLERMFGKSTAIHIFLTKFFLYEGKPSSSNQYIAQERNIQSRQGGRNILDRHPD